MWCEVTMIWHFSSFNTHNISWVHNLECAAAFTYTFLDNIKYFLIKRIVFRWVYFVDSGCMSQKYMECGNTNLKIDIDICRVSSPLKFLFKILSCDCLQTVRRFAYIFKFLSVFKITLVGARKRGLGNAYVTSMYLRLRYHVWQKLKMHRGLLLKKIFVLF